MRDKLQNIISGHRINEDDAAWLMALYAKLEKTQSELAAAREKMGNEIDKWRSRAIQNRSRAEASEADNAALMQVVDAAVAVSGDMLPCHYECKHSWCKLGRVVRAYEEGRKEDYK